jgi:hypothetical protein
MRVIHKVIVESGKDDVGVKAHKDIVGACSLEQWWELCCLVPIGDIGQWLAKKDI